MSKSELPQMLERVKTCKFCGLEMHVSALSYAENPFCGGCLDERQRLGRGERGYLSWRTEGDYFVVTDLSGQKPQ
jgi:hypothetical protein